MARTVGWTETAAQDLEEAAAFIGRDSRFYAAGDEAGHILGFSILKASPLQGSPPPCHRTRATASLTKKACGDS